MKLLSFGVAAIFFCSMTFAKESISFASTSGKSEPGNIINLDNLNKPEINFYSSSENTTVSLNYIKYHNNYLLKSEFSVPSSSENNTTLASLDGLAKYNTFSLSLNGVSFSHSLSPKDEYEYCKELAEKISTVPHADTCVLEDLKKKYKENHVVLATIDNIRQLNITKIWTYGLSASVGTKSFSYLPSSNPDSLTSDKKQAWSISANIALYTKSSNVIALEYKREISFKDNASGTFCTALLTQCLTGPIDAPAKKESDIITLQYRKKFLNEKAMTIKFSYDFDEDNLSLEAPYYFFGDSKSLNGGIVIGWTEADPGIKAGVFIGKAFEL